jgi:NAD(P)-dependent dehydrogenase (short-subunit alcohol dehydrogenase family)
MKGLKAKRIFITGGCGDIGLAVASRFLEEGSLVLLGDLRDEKEGANMARQLSETSAAYARCDVTNRASVEAALAAMEERFGGVDVVISNAGIVVSQPFLQITEEAWRKTLEVNLTGSFLVAQAGIRLMMKKAPTGDNRRGVVLFTGSWVQQMPWPEIGSYCASKGGQEMLMKVIAQEAAAHGITCNIVAPGMVYAGLTKGLYDQNPEYRNRADATVPLGRMSTVEEVAAAFVFLASAEGAYITGTSLLVDGGATLVRRN